MTEPQGVAPAPLAQEPLAPPPSICACGTSGFWYGWVVLACATTARCLKSFGQNNTLYLSVPGMKRDLGLSDTQLGTLFCVACVVSSTAQPLAGRLQDRYGGRVTMPSALLLLAAFMLLLARARSGIAVFVAFLGLRAVGLSALDTFSVTTVNLWFVKRRGTALAAMTVGYFGLTGTGTVQILAAAQRHGGWRFALGVGAGVCVGAAPVLAALLRRSPAAAGLTPDPPEATAAADAARAAAPPAGSSSELEGVTRREALRSGAFWALCFYTFCFFFTASGTDFHLLNIVAESGGVNVAGTVSPVGGLSAGVGSAAIGVALDRGWVSPRAMLVCSGLLLAMYTALLTVMSSTAVGVAAGLVKGLSDGAAGICLPFAFAGIFGRAHGGAIYSVNRGFGAVASGVGPLLLGLLHDGLGRYRGALRCAVVVPLAMATAAALMPWHARPLLGGGQGGGGDGRGWWSAAGKGGRSLPRAVDDDEEEGSEMTSLLPPER